MLSSAEKLRYARQTVLPGFGTSAQETLKNSKVLIVGCGGLGGPAALYLTSAGIGTLGLIDSDEVSLSNLQRQIIFKEKDLGLNKAKQAKKNLKDLNSAIKINTYLENLNAKNALEIIANYDIVVDGSDNFPTKYLINDACEILKKPFVFAAIHQFEAQISSCNVNGSSTYRDIFPEPPSPEMAPDCSTAGVLGALAGTIGSLQALEVIKILTAHKKPLINTLLVIDLGEMYFTKLRIKKNPDRVPAEKLIDYEKFCGIKKTSNSLSKTEFLSLKDTEYILVDVRTEAERNQFHIGGKHIIYDDLNSFFERYDSANQVILYCASGVRAQKYAEELSMKFSSIDIKYLKASLSDFY
jgi:sulfur-carrier protein adenylyltransferase/sulfurtransferase